ncbi:hypothetical protein V495_04169 [Pseudogymnoascus sp. VKM F-4514 (FW-929)]|nr:hypothetical protein V495_04169 [Pseudogymnoascus sp. VKM F-4514 (FW-929)]KFY67082.1 hypothetical protein V497_00574 [Pseudogymnoascus sp. VKM F-4516 (FW-969)]
MATATTNVDFTESRGAEVNVIAWVFTGIAIATVSLKLFARVQTSNRLGWDDFFIFFSLALSIIAAAFVSYSVTLGLGRHTAAVIADHGTERLVLTAKWQILGYPFNIGSFSFPNISIAILVNNLLDPNPLRAQCLYAMVIMQVVFAMASIFIIFLQCKPTEALWNPAVAGKCWDAAVFNDFSYWVSAYTTMTDIVLAVVPIAAFWKLQMPFATKLGVCIMMGLTLLSAIVTIIKATYLHLFTDRTDPLFNVVPLVLWGLVEQNVVLVAACIPTLRPFFYKAFRSKGSLTGNSNSRTRSASAFKLSSNPSHKPELTLDEIQQKGYDAESNNSQQGIWRTTEIRREVM